MLDDDPFVLNVQSRVLQSMGYDSVKAFTNGTAALAEIAHSPPGGYDIIICDVNMPGMDGIEFLQALSGTGYRGHVILLSGEGVRVMHTVQKLLRDDVVILGALEKPIQRAALSALMDCWVPLAAPPTPRSTPLITEAEMHDAIREQQWVLHYQPKINLKTGAFTGVEALVRWNHPRYGLVAPDRFICLAEEFGTIDALTGWIMQNATQQLARWRTNGLTIEMAINVSTQNLHMPGFSRLVGAVAGDAGVSPRDIVLEVTESQLMSSTRAPFECLVRLRLQGFGLSLDDFGTGHSSLVMLRDIPFTQLKVDRGFVTKARSNQIVRPILDASIGIATRMGMQSVAEGVETEDDWRLMRELGCDLAQGYFISRPLPAERVPEWLDSWRPRVPRLMGP